MPVTFLTPDDLAAIEARLLTLENVAPFDPSALQAAIANHETRIVALENGVVDPPPPDPDPQPVSGLMFASNLEYLGAFRVPNHSIDNYEEFSFGENRIALSAAGDSLFITGKNSGICEISKPAPVIGPIESLATATLLQPWKRLVDNLPSPLPNASDGQRIGGLSMSGGKLMGTKFAYYSGAHEQHASHFVIDNPANLDTTAVHGLYRLGDFPRAMAGYIAEVPAEHQAALGCKAISGLSGWPIITANSSGPDAYGYDPATITGTEPGQSPATPLLYYPSTSALGRYNGDADPIQNGTTLVGGCVFVPGTNSVLFFGHTATSFCGYGTPTQFGDQNSDGGTGPQSLNGEYAFQVWAYDVADLIAVKNGTKQTWEVKPYNVWNFDLPLIAWKRRIGGIAFDVATSNLYVSAQVNDLGYSYAYLPLIHVFHINTSIAETGPRIGTLTAFPQTIVPGPIAAGTLTDLVAGNVYAKPGKTIASVTFKVDGTTVGTGTLYPTQNYKHTLNTTGMASGDHTLEAVAVDSDGMTHSRQYTLRIA